MEQSFNAPPLTEESAAETRPPKYSQRWLNEIFTYHPATEEQKLKYEHIRSNANHFANVLIDNCPDCADRTAALRCLREAVHMANAAVALNGLV